MFDAGVQSCWLVQPATESITDFTFDQEPSTVCTGTLPATDIEIDLDTLFEEG